jgi:hypothetical protein
MDRLRNTAFYFTDHLSTFLTVLLVTGYETTKGLVSRGAKVYMACRDIAAAERAKAKIEQENTFGLLHFLNFLKMLLVSIGKYN